MFKKMVEKHIRDNLKQYLILILILILGLIVGIIIVNNSNETQTAETYNYITQFTNGMKEKEKINYWELLWNLIKSNTKIVLLIAFLSLSVFGTIGTYLIIGYKGLCIGYSISSIISVLGVSKGLLFAMTLVLLSKIISIPVILYLCINSLKLYKKIINNDTKDNLKVEILRYLILLLIVFLALTISSLIETFINTNLFLNIIKFL